MIGITLLPRDGDKTLLRAPSAEGQRKVDLKVYFNRNMAKSPSTCTTKTFPTRCLCNFLPSVFLIFFLYIKNFHMSNSLIDPVGALLQSSTWSVLPAVKRKFLFIISLRILVVSHSHSLTHHWPFQHTLICFSLGTCLPVFLFLLSLATIATIAILIFLMISDGDDQIKDRVWKLAGHMRIWGGN